MNRQYLKQLAKDQLGNNLFGNKWLMAVVTILVYGAIIGVLSMIPVVGNLASIVLAGPLGVALSGMFLKSARTGEAMQVGDIFGAFSQDFVGTFLLGLMEAIFICLWSMLFVIPGIIKAYSYSMAYYIKCDHPEYGWKECIDASKELTNGHKMELFILDLSFIGWAIVGALCCGVGSLWVEGYMEATKAQAYRSFIGEI